MNSGGTGAVGAGGALLPQQGRVRKVAFKVGKVLMGWVVRYAWASSQALPNGGCDHC